MRRPALFPQPPRAPLEKVMWAAWLGVDPERVPLEYTAHTCPDTMARWKRVGEAAVQWLKDQENAPS